MSTFASFCSICVSSLYIYHKMLEKCPYCLPCKRKRTMKRMALAAIFTRQSIRPWPVCAVRERKHTSRTSEKVCNKAQLYEYKQQDQTQTDIIYLIFSFIRGRQRFKHHLAIFCNPYSWLHQFKSISRSYAQYIWLWDLIDSIVVYDMLFFMAKRAAIKSM